MFTKNNMNMGAIRLIQKPNNGRITFTVPDDMRDEALVIEFWPVREGELQPKDTTLAEASNSFFEKLKRVKTDFSEGDFNVYEQ